MKDRNQVGMNHPELELSINPVLSVKTYVRIFSGLFLKEI